VILFYFCFIFIADMGTVLELSVYEHTVSEVIVAYALICWQHLARCKCDVID